MKKYLSVILVSMSLFTVGVFAEPLSVGADDTIKSILSVQMDKRVTIKLKSGNELTGKLAEVNDNVIHIKELAGKEFFDAVISTEKIEAIVIRTRS